MTREAEYRTITRCRSCGSEELTPLFSLGEQFVSDFVARDRVHSGPMCPIDIILCRSCTLVQQRHTAPQDFMYTRHYWYVSSTTQTMRDALRDVALAAVKAVGGLKFLDVVLDIGSNDGTLLRCYDEFASDVALVGVEPANNLATPENYRNQGLNLIHDFWGTETCLAAFGRRGKKAKIITAAGMMYDLPDPNPFIRDVARVLAPDGVFVAQLMCLRQTLEKFDVGNFCHEHLEFYSLRSLSILFARHGLEIFDIEENDVNGGSYRLYVQHAKTGKHHWKVQGQAHSERLNKAYGGETRLHDPATYADFFARLEKNKQALHNFVLSEVAGGKKVHVLGASTKGNCILQWADLDNRLIEAASDRSPDKWGRYTVGTGIPIVSEKQSREMRPDFYLCLPYAFRAEMMERERAFRERGGKFLFPLPTFEVV